MNSLIIRVISVLFVFSLGLLCISDIGAVIDESGQSIQPVQSQAQIAQEVTISLQNTTSQDTESPEYIPDELIVKFKDVLSIVMEERVKALNEKYNVRSKEKVFKKRPNPQETIEILKSRLSLLNKIQKKGWYWYLGINQQDNSIINKKRQLKQQIKSQEELITRLAARQKRSIKKADFSNLENIYLLKTDKETDILMMAEEYSKSPYVEYAEPNYIVKAQMVPNDPYYHSKGSWGQSYDDLWGLKKIETEKAWDKTAGNENIIIAIVDTGIDYNHEDLTVNMWRNGGEILDNGIDDDNNGYIDDYYGYDFQNSDGDPRDDYGHGTHCAGIAAARGNNSIGIIGVCPNARVMAVKFMNKNGSGSLTNAVNALVYAADNGADILSNSWGAKGTSRTLIDVLNYTFNLGCVNIAAAGNDGINVRDFTPAGIDTVLAVAATNVNDFKAGFSNYGAEINVAAPGVDILSLRAEGTSMGDPVGERYCRASGTSMACPHVAGLAALVLSVHPDFTPDQVRQVIQKGSDDLIPQGVDFSFGYGRINAAGTLSQGIPLNVYMLNLQKDLYDVPFVSISGTVSGQSFQNWRLEYGQIIDDQPPQEWKLVVDGTNEVIGGHLTDWYFVTVPDGRHVLRLQGQNRQGETFDDRREIVIDRVWITSPDPTRWHAYRAGAVIKILGTVNPSNFTRYTFEVKDSGGQTIDAGITLANNGLLPVREALLGTWDTSGVSADHYTLTLVVELRDGTRITENVYLLVDPSFHEGWPLTLPCMYDPWFGSAISPYKHCTVADVNDDGLQEILIAYNKTVYVKTHDGKDLSGWPQEISQGLFNGSPLIADLTGDSQPEIIAVVNCTNKAGDPDIYVWQADGTLVSGWPKSAHNARSAAIADINGDGWNEIICTTVGKNKLLVLDHNGDIMEGWPIAFEYWPTSSPVVADVDGDGYSEIAVSTRTADNKDHCLYLYRHDGTLMHGWPVTIQRKIPGQYLYKYDPVLGDLNRDGFLELLISIENQVLAFDYKGNVFPGWPCVIYPKAGPVTLADINDDGGLEVIVGTSCVQKGRDFGAYLWTFDGNGRPLPNWPVYYQLPPAKNPEKTYYLSTGFNNSSAVIDINGDNQHDIVVSMGTSTPCQPLHAYRHDGTMIDGFPKKTLGPASPLIPVSPAIVDLDNDGFLELFWVDFLKDRFTFYMWDLDTPVSSSKRSWPMYRHDPQQTGAVTDVVSPPPVNQPPIAEAGENQVVYENYPAGLVTLDGRASYDPDNDALTYSWRQIPEPFNHRHNTVIVELIDPECATPIFEIPQVGGEDNRGIVFLAFELTVSDGEDISTDIVNVEVLNKNYQQYYKEELDNSTWQTEYDYQGRNYEFLKETSLVLDGKESLEMWLNGANDDGTMWVEREIEVEPDETGEQEINVSFWIWQELSDANPWGGAVVYIGETNPEEEEDFEIVGSLNIKDGWTEYRYSKKINVAAAGKIWVAVGIKCTWESEGTFWLDKISVTTSSKNNPPTIEPIADQKLNENERSEVAITASDPDGDVLKIYGENLPAFARVDQIVGYSD
ncbi:MAG: S8 family serine peptidase, partial [Candidatus Omnitrophota bacterium]